MASPKTLAAVPASAARHNPLPHGFDAASLVIPGEDPAQLDALARDYYSEYRPQTATERHFTDALVLCSWRRRRYARVEAEMFRHLVNREKDDYPELYDRKTPVGQQFVQRNEPFNKLFRQVNANDRAYERALKSLRDLQARRPAPPPPAPEISARSQPIAAPPLATAPSAGAARPLPAPPAVTPAPAEMRPVPGSGPPPLPKVLSH